MAGAEHTRASAANLYDTARVGADTILSHHTRPEIQPGIQKMFIDYKVYGNEHSFIGTLSKKARTCNTEESDNIDLLASMPAQSELIRGNTS